MDQKQTKTKKPVNYPTINSVKVVNKAADK